MNISRFFFLVGLLPLALTTNTRAADMPYSAPGPQVQEFFSAWYLRGDVGYRFNSISGGTALGSNFISSDLKDTGTVGGGVGYKWGWFRADITFDYGSGPKFVGDIPGLLHVDAKLSSYTTLFNGYIDMGTWYGFTPYIGVGVGTTYLKPGQFTLTSPGTALSTTMSADTKWDFSWAAMAGLSYAIGPTLILDASYRYLDLGQARSTTVTITPPSGEVKYGDWTAQEVRIGLRYLIP